MKTKKMLFIDIENQPNEITRLKEHLAAYHLVAIVYAQQSGKLFSLDDLDIYAEKIHKGNLLVYKSPKLGKNAADFSITFLAGRITAVSPEITHFDIVSNDADLDNAIENLKYFGKTAIRLNRPVAAKK